MPADDLLLSDRFEWQGATVRHGRFGDGPPVVLCHGTPWLGAGQAAFYRQIEQADEAHTAELEPHLASVDVPTLIIWGTDDEWIPVDRADRLEAAIPTARVQLISGAGHLVQEDRPMELVGAGVDWLHGLRTGGE